MAIFEVWTHPKLSSLIIHWSQNGWRIQLIGISNIFCGWIGNIILIWPFPGPVVFSLCGEIHFSHPNVAYCTLQVIVIPIEGAFPFQSPHHNYVTTWIFFGNFSLAISRPGNHLENFGRRSTCAEVYSNLVEAHFQAAGVHRGGLPTINCWIDSSIIIYPHLSVKICHYICFKCMLYCWMILHTVPNCSWQDAGLGGGERFSARDDSSWMAKYQCFCKTGSKCPSRLRNSRCEMLTMTDCFLQTSLLTLRTKEWYWGHTF